VVYAKLDSDRFPVKSYSDITERVAGKPLRFLSLGTSSYICEFDPHS
jgi:hypothetical protein